MKPFCPVSLIKSDVSYWFKLRFSPPLSVQKAARFFSRYANYPEQKLASKSAFFKFTSATFPPAHK